MNHLTELEDVLASPVRGMAWEMARETAQTARETAQTDLATRHRSGVTQLLADRDDLRGVYAFADVIEESVRWSV